MSHPVGTFDVALETETTVETGGAGKAVQPIYPISILSTTGGNNELIHVSLSVLSSRSTVQGRSADDQGSTAGKAKNFLLAITSKLVLQPNCAFCPMGTRRPFPGGGE